VSAAFSVISADARGTCEDKQNSFGSELMPEFHQAKSTTPKLLSAFALV